MHIHVLYIYPSSSSHRRRIVVRRPSSCPYPNASIARDTHACIHPSIHPSIHPPIHRATRRDATLPATSRRCTKKITSRARKYYDASTTRTPRTWIFVALKAATRETKEDARRADIVCVCVCENAVRGAIEAEEADDATTIRTSDDATIRTSDACMATPLRAASLVRGRGRHRSMGHRVPVVVIGHIFELSGHTRDRPRGRWCVCVYSI